MNLLAFDTASDACSVALSVNGELLSDHQLQPQQHARLLLPMIDALMAQAGLAPAQLDGVCFGRGPGSFTGLRIAAAAAQGIALAADIGVVGVSSLQALAQACVRQFADTHVLAVMDARMSEVYVGAFALGYAAAPVGTSAAGASATAPVSATASATQLHALIDESVCAPDKVEIPSVVALQNAQQATATQQDAVSADAKIVWALAGSALESYHTQLDQGTAGYDVITRPVRLPDAIDLLTLGEQEIARHGLLAPEHAVPVYLRNKVALTEAERARG